MILSQRIETLTAALKDANGKLVTLTGERDTLLTEKAGWETKHTEQAGQITKLTTDLSVATESVTKLTAENVELKEKLAKLEGNISGQVIERIASAGVPAIAHAPTAAANDPSAAAQASGTPRERLAATFNAELN